MRIHVFVFGHPDEKITLSVVYYILLSLLPVVEIGIEILSLFSAVKCPKGSFVYSSELGEE